MAEDRAALKVTNDLKASISAILQGYGDGRGPVTDASAELHRLCGCLELLLQFDQKAHRSFLGARRDYWDFLSAALQQQRGDTEKVHLIRSQDKLKTPLGKGRAFIRLCLARGQLAESLQLCLLSPELTREWYGPRSPLLCPELREDILDGLYALNGVTFDLDLQQPDLDGAWPMFSESRCCNASQTQGRRQRKIKGSPKEGSAALGRTPLRERPEGLHSSGASCLQDALREDLLPGLPSSPQPMHLPAFLEKKGEDFSCPQKTWELEGKELHINQEDETPKTERFWENSVVRIQPWRGKAKDAQKEGLETKEGATTTEKPQEPTQVTSETTQEDPAEVALQEVVKGLRNQLQQAREQAQGREQLLRVQEEELRALREQLSRCQRQKARLQAELEQERQEAERRDATYEGELAGQRDLVQAMKRRVLELIREKDNQWQRLQQLSALVPGHCVGCSKIFGRLSRRYPCRLCGGLVCHACSADYKKNECCCPPCAQRGDDKVT
uniref:RUN and FYVE domain-containing protein 4 n=1 Tax=Jaculus jaculus TaxID=51337 RepID=UPI001E1B220F|nr:RUN and FYVE domain-containing protein 4 [Jaculus jaculus]XP_045003577.1 RUN and FYVE domain-containing protein 4 [Jaculus jaculus]XP_045003578.1 RUN and FYVE domain-containing protein 4 [Jaculus jaculus]